MLVAPRRQVLVQQNVTEIAVRLSDIADVHLFEERMMGTRLNLGFIVFAAGCGGTGEFCDEVTDAPRALP